MNINLKQFEVWFLTGSQHLYGDETLKQVAAHSEEIVRFLNDASALPVRVAFKPVLTGPDAIARVCREANSAPDCIGVIAWMHTFSPAKMWIAGLTSLRKPLVHLHTQSNRDLPWQSIDMDFMNLNQSAHGDREFGFLMSRLRLERKVIVGFWQDPTTVDQLAIWSRAAAGWHDAQSLKVARFGDNMRDVAVTEGDKVAAQIQFGYSVDGFGTGDLVPFMESASDSDVDRLISEYEGLYTVAQPLRKDGQQRQALREAAKIELGLRAFLDHGGYRAFTDTFQILHGVAQLPGIAAQRLMADGYGFGAEGDWKTAALLRTMKVMSAGLPGGTSFMEDYTYHFGKNSAVLGAHMLEICPSIANGKPSLEIHPLSIGGKADPVRLVFTAPPGPAINASLVHMGNRFRLVVNEVEVVAPEQAMPKLPVARALWIPKPDLKTGAAAWILAGGAHHTVFTQALATPSLEDFARIARIELLVIDGETKLRQFENELRWNDAAYSLRQPFA